MRGLKSTTAVSTATSSTTLRGKRKLAESKGYPDSPPATPPQDDVKAKKTYTRKLLREANSPPAKRRRSSDRIANKKRQSMEDDDGFTFTRAPKQRRKATKPEEPLQKKASNPSVVDFSADVCQFLLHLIIDSRHFKKSISTNPSTKTDSTTADRSEGRN